MKKEYSSNDMKSVEILMQQKPANPRVVPMSYQVAGLLINQVARVNSDWASNKLADMWFTVFKRRPRPWVHAFWRSADSRVEIHFNDKCIPVYLWGQGPLVVLVHGWSGTGTQYRYFIPQLIAAGFQVALFDAPAHGLHPERSAHLLDFSDMLVGIQHRLGPIHAVIAHSLGCMGSVLATHRGLKIQQLVMLAPHLDAKGMLDSYAQQLKLSSDLQRGLTNKIGERMRKILSVESAWDLLHAPALLKGVEVPGVLMFDSDDKEVPQAHFLEINTLWNPGQTVRTSGLGHIHLLKDKTLITHVVDYLHTAYLACG